jgi:bifunctional DNA-binding transcriptional regulator/antitoxin component of YhaV-PrlF toxin-antitoxin module
MEKHMVKLTKVSGYSYTVVIPKEIVEKYGWREKQKMTIEDKGRGRVEIKDWRSRNKYKRLPATL